MYVYTPYIPNFLIDEYLIEFCHVYPYFKNNPHGYLTKIRKFLEDGGYKYIRIKDARYSIICAYFTYYLEKYGSVMTLEKGDYITIKWDYYCAINGKFVYGMANTQTLLSFIISLMNIENMLK